MFYVTVDNGGYDEVLRFSFKHNIRISKEGRPYGSTECRIERLDVHGEWNVIKFGRSRCSKEDMFHKPTGRKLALTRAVEGMNKDVRTAIWDSYFSHTSDLKG